MQFESPLQWPQQQPRTKNTERSRFGNSSAYSAGKKLCDELERLGAKKSVISTNLRERMRGCGFYSNQTVDDVGVAVYFELKGVPKVIACDKWDRVEHNLHALALSIAAIRGLERWGGSEFLDGLFTGFTALPVAGGTQTKNHFAGIDNIDDLKIRFRKLAHELHPDKPSGSHQKFTEMKAEYDMLIEKFVI